MYIFIYNRTFVFFFASCRYFHACHVTRVSLQRCDDRPGVMSRRQSRAELGQPRLRHDCRVEQKEKRFVWRQVCGWLLPLTSLPHPDSPLLPPHFLLGCSLTPPLFPQVWRTLFSLSHSVAFIFFACNELSSFIILGDSAPACHGEALALEAGPKSRHSPGWRGTKTIYCNDKTNQNVPSKVEIKQIWNLN